LKNLHYIFLLLLCSQLCFSQKEIVSTDEFQIFGLVEKSVTIKYSDLEKEKIVTIGDFKINNHLGEFRKEYKNVKGVLLSDVFKSVKITAESPKLLSEYFFICKASDGYSVVISWNEFFNTDLNSSFLLVLEADGKSLKEGTDKILLIAAKDHKTGRRHVKGLQSIEIKRI
jgi:hypothetical protein